MDNEIVYGRSLQRKRFVTIRAFVLFYQKQKKKTVLLLENSQLWCGNALCWAMLHSPVVSQEHFVLRNASRLIMKNFYHAARRF